MQKKHKKDKCKKQHFCVLTRCFTFPFLALCMLGFCACTPSQNITVPTQENTAQVEQTVEQTEQIQEQTQPQEETEMVFYAKIGTQTLQIQAEDNTSAQAFLDLLAEGDMTVQMQDYGGFEKVGSLGTTLPKNDTQITTQPGDVILYQGNQITIYYDNNTWNFTRLGKVQDLTQQQLKEILGDGNVTVTFSLK